MRAPHAPHDTSCEQHMHHMTAHEEPTYRQLMTMLAAYAPHDTTCRVITNRLNETAAQFAEAHKPLTLVACEVTDLRHHNFP